MTTQRKGIFAETTAKAYLLKNENVLTILEPLKAYGIVDILVITNDFKIQCYDVKYESKRKRTKTRQSYRITRMLNAKQKEFARINNIEFNIIYVSKDGKCHIKNKRNNNT